MHQKKAITLLAMLMVAAAVFAGGKVEERALEGSSSVDLSNAEITYIYPLNVLPGTLVTIFGEGFGDTAGVVTVGGTTISTFVGWDDQAIHFRLPAQVAAGTVIQVGDSVSEQELSPAPAGSFTVQFQVDTAAVATEKAMGNALRSDQRALLNNDPVVMMPPLYFKGEWYKSGEYFGNREAAWDGGSKIRMVQAADPNIWLGETVVTPENSTSFLLPNRTDRWRPMKFAFEDGNDDERNLVEFESDWAFVLKKDFALTDEFTTLHSDPAVMPAINDDNGWYVADDNTVYAAYPVK